MAKGKLYREALSRYSRTLTEGVIRDVSFATFVGYFTGLRLLGDTLSFPTLLGTALLVHLLDGIMCRLFAHNNGYPKNLWTLLGFVFGIWAMATLVLLPRRPKE